MGNLVLALDATGYPTRWMHWKDGITAIYTDQVAWSIGDETIYYGGSSRLTGEVSSIAVPSIIAIKGYSKIKRRVPPLTNRNLFGRDLCICGYCGHTMPHEKLTRDHIIPTSKGGTNTWQNCVSACKACNCAKDNKTLAHWGKELLYVPYVPDRCEHLIMANRKITADQMQFLANHLPKHSRMLKMM